MMFIIILVSHLTWSNITYLWIMINLNVILIISLAFCFFWAGWDFILYPMYLPESQRLIPTSLKDIGKTGRASSLILLTAKKKININWHYIWFCQTFVSKVQMHAFKKRTKKGSSQAEMIRRHLICHRLD